MPITVEPLHGTLGVRISGVDLSRDMTEDVFSSTIRPAFVERHLVSFPGQSLTPEQFLAFSARFGALEPHVLSQYHHPRYPEIVMLSNVVENGKPLGIADGGAYWHSDLSYKASPSRATGLYAVEVPDEGGDTLFANMIQAYAELPESMKTRLAGLRGVHDYSARTERQVKDVGVRKPLTDAQRKATPPVSHPVVRHHPETGQPALYVNPGFTVRLEGLPEAESASLLAELFAHCLQDRFCMRYKWHPGDVIVWDNAALIHCATAIELPPGKRRTLWRTVIGGSPPN